MIDPVQRAEAAILHYLTAHQDARDTIEGIEKWWLPQSRDYGLADVAAALQALETRNLIQVWRSGSTKPVYGRGWADSDAVSSYMESLE